MRRRRQIARGGLPSKSRSAQETMAILTAGTGVKTTHDAVLTDIDNAVEMALKSTLGNPQ